ncbi:MAG TPA: hypothetical protein VHC40_14205 [Rhizomicrobium sp.]|nr:hypothetical protein [Rhizomicrobium sp.]
MRDDAPDPGLSSSDLPLPDWPHPDWLDTMVKKLIAVLQNQIEDVSKTTEGSDARSRAADARTLAALERTLERLSRLERERAAVRERKIAKDGRAERARAALERRLDKRLAAAAKTDAAGKPER